MIHRLRRPVRLPGRQHQLQSGRPATRLLAVDDRRPLVGRDLCSGGGRLHAGVRRAAVDQLRAFRDLHARHVRRLLLPRHHPGLYAQRKRLQQGHRADGAIPRHRDAVRDAGVGVGGDRAGVRGLPPAAQAQRPLADLPDHRDRHVRSCCRNSCTSCCRSCSRATAAATRSSRSSWCSPRRSSPFSAPRSPTSPW